MEKYELYQVMTDPRTKEDRLFYFGTYPTLAVAKKEAKKLPRWEIHVTKLVARHG